MITATPLLMMPLFAICRSEAQAPPMLRALCASARRRDAAAFMLLFSMLLPLRRRFFVTFHFAAAATLIEYHTRHQDGQIDHCHAVWRHAYLRQSR